MAPRLLNCRRVGGIIGKLSFERDEPLAQPVLEQMLEAVRHRGRDARRIFVAPGIALGWCGDAPASGEGSIAANTDATVRVVADSTLTNRRELTAALARRGHRFSTDTDAELIAHAYDEWGDACVEHLSGPCACAIWDSRTDRLLLARDHVGVRPLYFAFLHGHGVVFASEIRALLKDPGVGREWCPIAIDAYLALGYVPAPFTAYQRVSKVEPAQRLIVEGHRCHLDQYWDLPLPDTTRPIAADDAASAVEAALRRAVRAEVVDGRVNGTLYSGGTASCALLATTLHGAGEAITVALEEDTTDVARSHATARTLGWNPRLESASTDIPVVAADLAAHFDEPVADPAAINQYAMCVAARQHADCALSGHGAAALWAGHTRHRVERVEQTVRSWLGPLAGLGSIAHAVQHSVKGARALSHLTMTPAAACATKYAYGLWEDEYRRSIYTRGFAWQVRDADPFARHRELYLSRQIGDALDRALYVEARTFLPDSTLAIAERAALATGLTLRFPYLDRELVELSAEIPASLKQHGTSGMEPVRRLLERRLPPALMPAAQRRPSPHSWLDGALLAMVPRVLLAERFDGRGIVSRPALRHVWDEHCAGARDHGQRLWSLLMLELWFRKFIDGNAADEPLEYAVVRAA